MKISRYTHVKVHGLLESILMKATKCAEREEEAGVMPSRVAWSSLDV